MRRVNGILTVIILILFIIHGVLGAFQLIGAGSVISRALSYALLTVMLIHTMIGIKLTADTFKVSRSTGVSYTRLNLLFHARRISGFAILFLMFFHVRAFSYERGSTVRLHYFGSLQLLIQLMLIASIAVHVLMNIKPLMITLGIRSLKDRAGDIWFILSVLLLFMAAAMYIYYRRWL